MKRNSLFLALAQAAAFSSYAATIRVTTTNDVDAMECTLRDAIVSANTDTATGACDAGSGADTIAFDAMLATVTLTVASALPDVTESVTISGPASDELAVDLNGNAGLSIISQSGDAHTISGITFQGGEGHALLAEGGTMVLDDVTVTANTVSTIPGVIRLLGTAAEIRNSTISDNYSSLSANAGVYAKDSDLTVIGSSFTGNRSYADGGALFADGGNVTVTGSTFTANTAGAGGAILARDVANLAVHQSQFYGNQATFIGGGIYATSDASIGNIVIGDSLFSGQNAGAISAKRQSLDVQSTTISDSSVGSAMRIEDSELSADDFRIFNNTNGGIFAADSTIVLTNSVVSGNGVGGGGGIRAFRSSVDLEAVEFVDNYSLLGGGVYLYDSPFSGALLSMSGNTGVIGGAIFSVREQSLDPVTFTLESSTLSENSVTDSNRGSGGAISLQDIEFQLNDVTFTANTAYAGGGFFSEGGSGQGTQLQFYANHADRGGALFLGYYSSFLIGPSVLSLEDSVISGNSAERAAGGIWVSGLSTVTVIDTTITGNTAYNGGGIGAYGPECSVTIQNSQISNNHAEGIGGGIAGPFQNLELSDSTVSGNTAGQSGGGLYLRGTVGSVINSTISENHAPSGSAVVAKLALIQHSTVAANSGAIDAFGFYGLFVPGYGYPTIRFTNSVIANEGPECGADGVFTFQGINHFNDTSCNGIDSGDPMLTEVASNGGPTPTQHPRAGSPVIDAADPAFCPPFDQRGEIRGATPCDIGAVEVVDINQPPRIDDQSFVIDSSFVADELVGPIEFSDPEMLLGADPLSIIGPDHGFRVEADGMIFVDSAIVPGVTTLTVEVTDPGGLSDRATILIDVVELPLFRDGFEIP